MRDHCKEKKIKIFTVRSSVCCAWKLRRDCSRIANTRHQQILLQWLDHVFESVKVDAFRQNVPGLRRISRGVDNFEPLETVMSYAV